jgi:hypothetical protein
VRLEITALFLAAVSACTSVTQVSITPNQLHSLAGLPPDEERELIAPDRAKDLVARGDDEVRLQVRPGGHAPIADMPWVQLCQLRWEDSYGFDQNGPTGVISDGVLRVTGRDLVGAEVRITRPDGGRTAALVVGIVLGAVALSLAIGAFVLLQSSGPANAK